ncbi:MAG: fructose-1,6-bisphosphatase [Lachnospiraceae bacterium]|nr:fructose-1,6-bisphosphatase [Lachnospiraceae bacterium]
MKRDDAYLKLLGEKFPNARKAGAEIINLRAICALPKGTEYFFSDLHGEYRSFIHLLRSSSGIIRDKIQETYGNELSEQEQLELANLIYYPQKIIEEKELNKTNTKEWQKLTIHKLVHICSVVSHKYTRSKVHKKMPQDYAYAIDELLHVDEDDADKRMYYREILNSIIDINRGNDFIKALCRLIQNLTIDNLHILGDIFDRGPRADFIMNELMNFHDVDIQWGNHDVSWMGAAAGNPACIATVLRIAISYNTFDVLEDGYGINLRPLSMYAADVYGDDPCECFQLHLLEQNVYDEINPDLAAKMYKAITIIGLKLEGQLIQRHPEYELDDRLLLHQIDYDKGTITIHGKDYPLKDHNFPTIDPQNPYALTKREQELVNILTASFTHSKLLQDHIRFIYSHGGMYKVCNNNLLFHGCIPMNRDGSFMEVHTKQGPKSGKAWFDYIEKKIVDAYFSDPCLEKEKKQDAVDFMWYLWCGPKSPLFGKDKIATFEHVFLSDAQVKKEHFNCYYELSRKEEVVDRILEEFGIDPLHGHIINGHVPVKVTDGESPIKAGGKLFIIDGGLSKAYHAKTGIAGYTLIYNSRHLALAEHRPFVVGEENTPTIKIVEQMQSRVLVRDTDIGKQLLEQIDDLTQLIEVYEDGRLL